MRERSPLIDKRALPLSTTDVVTGIPTLDVNLIGTVAAGSATAANQVTGNNLLTLIEADLVPNVAYVSGAVAISTTQVEARVGGAPLANRITLTIENTGASVIYVGPTGVTSSNGLRIMRGQVRDFVVGPGISVFMVTASGVSTAIVQEMS